MKKGGNYFIKIEPLNVYQNIGSQCESAASQHKSSQKCDIPTLQEAVHATDEGGQHVVRGAQVPDQVHPGTEQGHQQVSHCQVHQVPVGGAPQVAVEVHHQNDEQVANHGHHEHKHVRHDLGAENSIV